MMKSVHSSATRQINEQACSDRSRPRVLLLFSSSALGGAERSLSRMALASRHIDYQLATLDGDGPWCDWIQSQGHEPLVFGRRADGGRSRSIAGAIWRLICYLRRLPVDAIYVCGARASFLLRIARCVLPPMKLVHGVRWNPASDSSLDRAFRLMERYTHFLVDAWITNSAAAKQTLVTRCAIPPDRISVIYNGFETLSVDAPPLRERPLEVLTVANLNPRKGHREYLQVIRDVVRAVPDARFVFVGRDDMNGEVQRTIVALGLSRYVRYEGFQADVSPWLRRARLMVLPSLWDEGCPTSILEGFAHGLPVVAYAIDGIPELVDDGVDGFLVDRNRPTELARVIIRLLKDVTLAESMGRAGKNKVLSRFTLFHCDKEHERTFRLVQSNELCFWKHGK